MTKSPKLISGYITGKVVSKANSRRVTRSGLFIKSADALAFEQTAWAQIPHDLTPIEGDVLFIATIYYANRRPDLDESLVLDVLQQQKNKAGQVWFNGVYVNDRQVKAKIILHALDKDNPRIEFTVAALDEKIPGIISKCINDVKTTYNK
jgi:hypothetical protein